MWLRADLPDNAAPSPELIANVDLTCHIHLDLRPGDCKYVDGDEDGMRQRISYFNRELSA